MKTLLLCILLLPSLARADWVIGLTNDPGGLKRRTLFSLPDGQHYWQVTNSATSEGHWQPVAGGSDSGGTNSRQGGSLVLSNLVNNPYTDYTNAGGLFQPLSVLLTDWSLYPTNVWNSRQGGSAALSNISGMASFHWTNAQASSMALTNLAANPIPFTNLLVQGSGITLTTNSGVVTIAASGGAGDAGGTNSRQHGTLALTNLSGLPSFKFTNVTITTRATANIVNTNTAFVDATNLTFAVAANVNYRFRFVLHYTSAAAGTGVRFAINGPASQTALRAGGILPTATAAMNSGSLNIYDTAIFAATAGPGSTAVMGTIEGVFRNGANSGTLALRVASEIANSAVTILADSHGELTPF